MSNDDDTRPTVAAKAGDWVELRCGWIVGPLIDSDGDDDFPLVCMDNGEPSWSRSGKYLRGDATHDLDIVAVIGSPTEPVKADDSPPDHDPINGPSYYRWHPTGIECIDITEHFVANLAQAMAYIWRAGRKTPDPMEDLNKATYFLEREKQRIRKFGGTKQ